MTKISNTPEISIAIMGTLVVGGFVFYRLVQWVREAPVTPDPWDAKTEEEVQEQEATPVCHRCFTPHAPNQWFCEHCGAAVGDYNNVMPYVDIFSQGEVLRNGLHDRMRNKPLIVIGYLLYTFSVFTILAPLYWIWFFKKLNQHRDDEADADTNETVVKTS